MSLHYFLSCKRNYIKIIQKLEYIIETSDENIFTIEKMDYFTCELSFNNLTKGLYWYIQPNIFISGLSLYGQNTDLLYDIYKYFINNPVAEHKLMLDKEDCISHNTTDTYNTYTQSYKYFNNISNIILVSFILFCLLFVLIKSKFKIFKEYFPKVANFVKNSY